MLSGICDKCGCVVILDEVWEGFGCPACRAVRVQEAFKPVDSLRTALGVCRQGIESGGEKSKAFFSYLHNVLDLGVPISDDTKDALKRNLTELRLSLDCHDKALSIINEIPSSPSEEEKERMHKQDLCEVYAIEMRVYRIPLGEQAQRYELKRMFRL